MNAPALLPSEVLAKAADLIEPEGAWTQDVFARDVNGDAWEDSSEPEFQPVCFCLYGALNVASGAAADTDHAGDRPEERFVRAALELPDDAWAPAVAIWNDDPDRTQAEVVATLRAAAELAKAEGQ